LANASTAEPAVGENAKRDVSWIGYSVFYFVSSSQTHVVLCRDFKARLFFPLVIESHHGFFFETDYYPSFTTTPVLFAGRRSWCPALGLPASAALGFATREIMIYQ
jgi:hypothetical protein